MGPHIHVTLVHVTRGSHIWATRSCGPADPYTTRVGTRVGILVELVVKQLKASTTAVKNSRRHHLSISIIAANEIDRDAAPLAHHQKESYEGLRVWCSSSV